MNEMNILTVNGASYALRDMLAQDMLADLCSGYNGVTYPDAGEAVRKQLAELEAKIRAIADLPGGGKPVNLFDPNALGIVRDSYFGESSQDMIIHSLYGRENYHVSDYIPVKEGRRYTTNRDGTGFVIADTAQPWSISCWFYDKDKIPLSRPAGQRHTDTQIYTTVAPMGAVYARIDFYGAGDTVMFVEGDTFPDTYIAYDPLAMDPVLRLPIPESVIGQFTSPLSGKTAIFAGDSVCAGLNFSDEKSGYAGRIAEKHGMTYRNFAVTGATVTQKLSYSQSGAERCSVSAQVEQMKEEFPNADYIIFEGGAVDADQIGSILGGNVPTRFGGFTPGDFSGDYDTETFCGALESIFYRATEYWRGKKIGFILPHKTGISDQGYGAEGNNRRAYLETVKAICQKWGIPALDLWDGCYLNPALTSQYTSGVSWQENLRQNNLYANTQSLLPAGYDYIADIIGNWMKTL